MSKDQAFLKTDMFKDIRKLINIIDQIRDYGLQQDISLPRIAVLGTQSSGKSSLLENIVGLDFLPRGSGVVTRRPLQLRLVHIDARKQESKPYAIFQNDKNKRYTNFNEVRDQIQKLTDDLAGKSGRIIDDPIKLTIKSNDCPDLTIIDLPGITRIDVKQQTDVFALTTNMAKRYCSDQRTIILCVVPANQDLSLADGLKMARQWDKDGQRTIGVITKIDIMDKGTSAKKALLNQQIHLKLGYIGIVNRAQQDINNRVPVEVALKKQKQFFSNHPQYKDLPDETIGTRALTRKLSQQLVIAIKRALPKIMDQIKIILQNLQIQLQALGTAPPGSMRQKSNYLMRLITEFSTSYKNTISGKFVVNTQNESQIIGKGAKIKQKFKTIFCEYTSQKYDCSTQYSNQCIKDSILSHQGDQIAGFPSMQCFRSLLLPQLQKLKQPVFVVLEQIFLELWELASQLSTKVFSRFNQLFALVGDIIKNKLEELKLETQQILNTIFEAQMSTIFTNDQKYLTARDDLLAKTARQNDDPETLFIEEIRVRLTGYFRIVVKVLNDSIPKIMGHFLVKRSQQMLQLVLYNELNHDNILEQLGEPKHIEEQRKNLNNRIIALKKSKQALKNDETVSKIIDED